MKEIVAGVDGGGSKTRLIIATDTGEELANVEGPRSAMRPGEAEKSGQVIADMMREALAKASILDVPTILYAGFAGVGREEERRDLETELNRLGVAEEVIVDSDAAIALADAFNEGPGIILLSGTGSIAYGRGIDGTLVRTGGWGPAFGDEGSGFWIGKRALGIVAAASDGREPATELTGAILTAAQVNNPEDLIPWAIAASNTTIASLASVVMTTAAAGDARANALVSLAAEELIVHVRALAKPLFGDERAAIPIALSGGLLQKGSLLRKKVEQRLRSAIPGAQVTPSEINPARGAVRSAIRRIRLPSAP
ncbi:MAG TPA: BadF/BadG/BcrA/BcrD ATPase family protein [Gemmatimonadaceae bacterium]|nr:BadF/BadG/BcrA/BcrD ATPase family protein [Gemmatimonadaceae bacterium]